MTAARFLPDFHFVAPNGNAVVLHRELVDTNGSIGPTILQDATIKIPAEAQKGFRRIRRLDVRNGTILATLHAFIACLHHGYR